MKRTLLPLIFILSFFLNSFSQDNKAYAITGSGNGDFNWMNIRQIDLSTGSVTKNIFENGKTKFSLIRGDQINYPYRDAVDQITAQKLNGIPSANIDRVLNGRVQSLNIVSANSNNTPTATMVAAAAFDSKHNKLFFAPMSLPELRWMDLSSTPDNPKFYSIHSTLLLPGDVNDEANHITRMAIGADGNGYAITNDGNHLIKFTTGKKIVITDLGSLIDGPSNNHISVHNKCSSWGGDIVGDVFGKLYLFTASKNIFKIDIDSKIATYLGSVTGLSGTYTVNGAAVDNNDNVVISSANTFDGFYKVSMKDFTATKLVTTGQVYNSSDLANSNLLFASQLRNTVGTAQLIQQETIGNEFISIYPNPVFDSQFKITFDNNKAGNYNVALTDIQGKLIMSRQVYVNLINQVENIRLDKKPANGVYLINITDSNKKTVYSDKIVIE